MKGDNMILSADSRTFEHVNFIKTRGEIIGDYNISVTFYSDSKRIKIRKYDKIVKTFKKGYEDINKEYDELIFDKKVAALNLPKLSFKEKIELQKYKEFTKSSLIRTKKLICDYTLENYNDFHSFITLTFDTNNVDDDVTNIDNANKYFQKWIKYLNRKYPNFKYLGVPEYQKRGVVHYHLMTSLKCGVDIEKKELLKTKSNKDGKYKDLQFYNLDGWNYGFSSAFDLSLTDDKFAIEKYISKYLFKDVDLRLFGRKKILKSNNLRTPVIAHFKHNDMTFKILNDLIFEQQSEEYTFLADKPYENSFTDYTFKNLDESLYKQLLKISHYNIVEL